MTDRKGTVMPATMTHRDQYDEGYKHGYHEGYLEGKYAGYKMGADLGRAEALAWMEDKAFLGAVGEMFVRFYREYYRFGDGDDRSDDEM